MKVSGAREAGFYCVMPFRNFEPEKYLWVFQERPLFPVASLDILGERAAARSLRSMRCVTKKEQRKEVSSLLLALPRGKPGHEG